MTERKGQNSFECVQYAMCQVKMLLMNDMILAWWCLDCQLLPYMNKSKGLDSTLALVLDIISLSF